MIFFEEVKNVFAACSRKEPDDRICKRSDACPGNCEGCTCGKSEGSCKRECLTLDQVRRGEFVSIVGLEGGEGRLSRLTELGLLPGMEVMVRDKAPFGGPMLVYVLGTILAIRGSEASQIMVEYKRNKEERVVS